MLNLPTPGQAALLHSEKLSRLIHQDISEKGGYISFARYMELALYAPGLGYYSAGSHKLGKEGDFVTAPLISPLFAQCIARQCQQILRETELNEILELGAGTGDMACDLLFELERLDALPEHYSILEISAELRERQRALIEKRCPHFLTRVRWLNQLPLNVKGVILANEVMDAMPVHCFKLSEGRLYERCVRVINNKFEWHLATPLDDALTKEVENIMSMCDLPDEYASEVNLQLSAWISTLAAVLEQGVILLFDYGYGMRELYHHERRHGTLKCFYQHRHHDDPFVFPGLQDLTAHVNFTKVAESAMDAGLSLSGYTTQASFLLACGLMEMASSKTMSEREIYQQSQAIRLLTLPSEMGEIVKVIGLQKNVDTSLVGFSLFDRRHDL